MTPLAGAEAGNGSANMCVRQRGLSHAESALLRANMLCIGDCSRARGRVMRRGLMAKRAPNIGTEARGMFTRPLPVALCAISAPARNTRGKPAPNARQAMPCFARRTSRVRRAPAATPPSKRAATPSGSTRRRSRLRAVQRERRLIRWTRLACAPALQNGGVREQARRARTSRPYREAVRVSVRQPSAAMRPCVRPRHAPYAAVARRQQAHRTAAIGAERDIEARPATRHRDDGPRRRTARECAPGPRAAGLACCSAR